MEKMLDPGFGINIPDPQHWFFDDNFLPTTDRALICSILQRFGTYLYPGTSLEMLKKPLIVYCLAA
jgi:hypothetical protein